VVRPSTTNQTERRVEQGIGELATGFLAGIGFIEFLAGSF
jgi:hypothetical protein